MKEVVLTMNCVLWFVIYCIVLSIFVGYYNENKKMHGMSDIKNVVPWCYFLLSHTISLISSLQYKPLFIGNKIWVFHNLACLPCCMFNLLSYFQYWPGNYLHSRRPSLSFLLTYLTQEIWCSIHLTTANCTTAFCKRRNNLQSAAQTMPLWFQLKELITHFHKYVWEKTYMVRFSKHYYADGQIQRCYITYYGN